jgi:hypothetical protein
MSARLICLYVPLGDGILPECGSSLWGSVLETALFARLSRHQSNAW